MPQSLSNVIVHLVYSTKDRKPFLRDPSLRAEMHKQIGGASTRSSSTSGIKKNTIGDSISRGNSERYWIAAGSNSMNGTFGIDVALGVVRDVAS